MKRTFTLLIFGAILLVSLLGAAGMVASAQVTETQTQTETTETTLPSDEATIPTDVIVEFDYADFSDELADLSNVSLEALADQEDTLLEEGELSDETRAAAEAGVEDGIRLAAEQGVNVSAEQEQAAIDSAVRAAAETEDASPEAIRAASKGASHGALLQSQEETLSREGNVSTAKIRASVYGSTAGALTQHQEATVTQLQSAAYGAAHGTTAQHQHANVTQMQHAAVGASAGAAHSAVQTQQTTVTQIQEAAQGSSYGALTQRQRVTVIQIQAAAFGAAGGGVEKVGDRKKDPKKVQEASMGAAKGALVQRQRASVEQIQAAARGACKGALVQAQRVSVTQVQRASEGAAKGAVSQYQVASVRQIQAAALGGASGVLTQVQRVDIIQIQHAAAGAARGAAGAAAQYQITNVEQIQAAAAGAGHGSVIQIQQVNIQQIQVITESAARGALSQHQRASVVQIQSAARGASEGTLSLTQIQIVNVQQIQIISERAAAETVETAVDIDVDVEETIYKYAKGAGKETDTDRDSELRSLFFDVNDETVFLANPNEVAVTVTVTSDDGDFETITLSPGESLTREFDRGVYTLTAESEDDRTVKIAGREEVTVNLGPELRSLTATVTEQTLSVENPNDDTAIVFVEEDGEEILAFSVPPTDERTQQLDPGEYTLSAQIGETGVPINGDDDYEVSIEAREIYLDVTVEEDGVSIENPSKSDVTVTATDDESGDEQEISVPGESTQSQTLEPGEYTLRGAADDQAVFLDGQEELSVTITQPPADFTVQIVDVPDSVEIGETLNVSVEITNDGAAEGEEEITLDIDEQAGVDTATVALEAGETETITLTYQPTEDDIGDRNVTVRSPSDTATETVEILGPEDDVAVGENGTEEDVEEGVNDTEEDVEEEVNGTDDEIEDGVNDTEEDVEDGVNDTEEDVEDGVNDTADEIEDGVGDADDEGVGGVDARALDSCTVITEAGAYELADDIEGAAADFEGESEACIRINASDVVLEGNDNALVGAGEGATIGVLVTGTEATATENVTIRNLRADSWGNGIQVGTDAARAEVYLEDVIASENVNNGVFVSDSGNASLETITVRENGGSGIYVRGGEAGSVANVTANRNVGHGVAVSQAASLTSMANVTANANDGRGIHISEGEEIGSMVNVTANSNGGHGVAISETTDVIADRFTVSDNGRIGVFLGVDVFYSEFSAVDVSDNAETGILIDASGGNVVRDSTIEDNGGPGISIGQDDENEFQNVTVRDNEGWQIESYDDDGTFTASELRIGEPAEFAFEAESVSIDDVDENELAALPEDARSVGDGVDVEGIETGVDVALEYEEGDGLVEGAAGDGSEPPSDGQIELWRYDGTEWTAVQTAGDEPDGSIEATLTEDGVYAPVLVDEAEGAIDLNVTVDEGAVTIENRNDTAVDVTATDDETGTARFIEVPANGVVTEAFDPGDYTLGGETEDGRPVTLNGQAELAITVSALDPAEFVIDSIETNAPIEAGELLEVTAQIENVGGEPATQEIVLDVDGQDAVDAAELELEGGASGTVELTYPTDAEDVGDLTVTVRTDNGTDTTVATVQESEAPAEAPEDDDADATDGDVEDTEEGEEPDAADGAEQTEDEDGSDVDGNDILTNRST